MNSPRPYRGEQDLIAMLQLLVEGRKAENGSYYIHTGDLKWWLYYPPLEGEYWNHIYLWDDPKKPGQLLGWALISPDWMSIDVYIQPEMRGSECAQEMYIWAEERALHVDCSQGCKTVCTYWIRQDDAVLSDHLNRRGFRLRRDTAHFCRSIDNQIPVAVLSQGFIVRSCAGIPEVAARARAQHAAFGSSADFERYLERFTRFMYSPVYQSELDIVAVAPGGHIGAFCIVWLDSINKVGLFEPVGTHPDYQRKGLGRAVMLEGLKRLKERGMQSAIVTTSADNLPAVRLYEAVGFRETLKLGVYEKEL